MSTDKITKYIRYYKDLLYRSLVTKTKILFLHGSDIRVLILADLVTMLDHWMSFSQRLLGSV